MHEVTPIVIQYIILSNFWGHFMPQGPPLSSLFCYSSCGDGGGSSNGVPSSVMPRRRSFSAVTSRRME